MAILDEELIRDANEDAEAIRHIRAQMPSSMSALCTDADLQQIIDATVDTLATSDILESQADADGFIDINLVKNCHGSLSSCERSGTNRHQRLVDRRHPVHR